MTYFEPPPLPGSGSEPAGQPRQPYTQSEPADPNAAPPQSYPPGPAPAAPWGPPAQNLHPRGTAVLVLGILSVTVMQILGPVAWVLGHTTLKEIDASGRAYANRSTVLAGMVLGIVGTVMGLIALVWVVLILLAFFSA